MKNTKRLKGFTLIELIVVIAIIGILCGILVPSMMNYISGARIRSQNNNAKVVFNATQSVVQEYYFKERTMDSAKLVVEANKGNAIGTGDFVFVWNGRTRTGSIYNGGVTPIVSGVVTSTSTSTTNIISEFARSVNKIFTGSNDTMYKVYVKGYIVKGVVCGRTDTDMYIGSFPVKRETNEKNRTDTITGYSVNKFCNLP